MLDGTARTLSSTVARRLTTAALAVVAALAWGALFTLDGFDAPRLGEAALARLAPGATGSRSLRAARLHLLPSPRLDLADVVLAEADGRFVARLPELTARLDWIALLTGRVRPAHLRLVRPELTLAAAEDQAPPPWSRLAPPARRVEVVQGVLVARRAGGGEERLQDIDLDLRWREADDPLVVDGAFDWRGDRVTLAAWLARPDAVRAGRESPARATVIAPRVRLTFDGTIGSDQTPAASGRLTAATPSLARLAEWLRLDLPLPGGRDAASLRAQINSRSRALSLSDAEVTLGANAFEGSLSLRRDGERPLLAGTLASGDFAADDWLTVAPAMTDADGLWSAAPYRGPRSGDLDLDVRISAAKARIGHLAFDETALSLQLKRGRLEISLGEASGYKGEFRGRLVVAPGRDRVETRATLQWTGIDAAEFLGALAPRNRLSGVSNGQLSVESAGASVADLAARLDGRGQLSLRKGEITGLDLEPLLRRPERRSPALLLKAQNGRTVFDSLQASLRAQRGLAMIENGALRGPGASVAFRGLADLAARSLSLRVEASQTGASANRLGFYLAGPWRRLRILDDVEPAGTPAGEKGK